MKKGNDSALAIGTRVKSWFVVAVNGNGFIFSVTQPDMRKTVCFALTAVLPFLSACDMLADMLEVPNSPKEVAEAEAIGSGCRQTGRSIEDCYALNPQAQKAAVFSGWKSMNEYMAEHNLKEVQSVVAHAEAPALQTSIPGKPVQAEPDQAVSAQARIVVPHP